MVERNWIINRYCFYCKGVCKFHWCDNCGHYFCSNSAKWYSDYDEFKMKNLSYPVHETCL